MTSNKRSDIPTVRETSLEDESSATIIKTELAEDGSDTEEIVPEMMVTVQVEERDDTEALDFSSVSCIL